MDGWDVSEETEYGRIRLDTITEVVNEGEDEDEDKNENEDIWQYSSIYQLHRILRNHRGRRKGSQKCYRGRVGECPARADKAKYVRGRGLWCPINV